MPASASRAVSHVSKRVPSPSQSIEYSIMHFAQAIVVRSRIPFLKQVSAPPHGLAWVMEHPFPFS